MIICHSRRFVFVHIHKTAGESVTQALAPHLQRQDLVVGATTLGGKLAGLRARGPLKKHSDAHRLQDYMGADWERYFSFTFVRDPVERARSLHRYVGRMLERRDRVTIRNIRFVLPGSTEADPRNWRVSRAYRATAGFSEFIRHPDFSMRPQWRSVCDASGAPLVDFIGRFERIDADFAEARDRIGLEGVTLPRRNASGSRPAAPVSPADRAHLHEMFRRDFEIFGYAAADMVRA